MHGELELPKWEPGTGAGGACDIEKDKRACENGEPRLGEAGEDVDAVDGEARTGDASGADESVSIEMDGVVMVVTPDPEGTT